jgi:hypothetical protein
MTIAAGVELPEAEIAAICRRHQVRGVVRVRIGRARR